MMPVRKLPWSERRSDREGSRHEVLEYAKDCLQQITGTSPEMLIPDSVIGEDIELESVALVEFQVALEDHFDLHLDPLQILECGSLDRIARYVLDEMAAQNRHIVASAIG